MSDKTRFTVRPFSRPARADLKDALRVNISASALLSLKVRAGGLCLLHQDGGSSRPAIAWQAVERIQDTVIQVSKVLQDLYGLRLGDKISISNSERRVHDVQRVELRELMQNDTSTFSMDDQLPDEDRPHWEWLLYEPLSRAETLIAGLRFDSVQARGQKRTFVISRLDGVDSDPSSSIGRFAASTAVSIVSLKDQTTADTTPDERRRISVSDVRVGGLGRQLEQINLLLRRFEMEFQNLVGPYHYRPSKGLLLYGPKGTGKSLVIDEMAACRWRNVIRLAAVPSTRTDLTEQVQSMFSNALHQQPCLIIIEQVEALAPKRGTLESTSHPSFLPALRKGFELVQEAAVLVVAEVKHPNNIEDSLRAHTRFGVEIELPVPSAAGRLEILRCVRGNADHPPEGMLQDVAERTHGYVGADLFALYQRIIESAAHRTLASHQRSGHQLDGLAPDGSNSHLPEDAKPGRNTALTILPGDVTTALTSIRPSAMQEVFLETPNIRWSDIGGQHDTKRRLQRAVSRPLRHQATMTRLNLRSNRGVLLYGPPGCSKTLLAKALATEAGLNFLAVKGAELVSMYVGESERAVREVFRKARAASPSIIFFDEFDSIASTRSGDNGGGGGGGGNLNVLTTLLNEMDGFEQLRNVLVVAATNRPEILDPALLRPGRLDNLVYVGPPDLQARREILALWLGKSDPAPDVDVDALAEMMAGASGAEIVSVCETAGGFAMDEEEQDEEGREPRTGIGDGDERVRVKIGMAHLKMAVGEARRGITEEVVTSYVEWGTGRAQASTLY